MAFAFDDFSFGSSESDLLPVWENDSQWGVEDVVLKQEVEEVDVKVENGPSPLEDHEEEEEEEEVAQFRGFEAPISTVDTKGGGDEVGVGAPHYQQCGFSEQYTSWNDLEGSEQQQQYQPQYFAPPSLPPSFYQQQHYQPPQQGLYLGQIEQQSLYYPQQPYASQFNQFPPMQQQYQVQYPAPAPTPTTTVAPPPVRLSMYDQNEEPSSADELMQDASYAYPHPSLPTSLIIHPVVSVGMTPAHHGGPVTFPPPSSAIPPAVPPMLPVPSSHSIHKFPPPPTLLDRPPPTETIKTEYPPPTETIKTDYPPPTETIKTDYPPPAPLEVPPPYFLEDSFITEDYHPHSFSLKSKKSKRRLDEDPTLFNIETDSTLSAHSFDEDDPTNGFKLPASKSPIMEAMVVCALNNWGIEIVKNQSPSATTPTLSDSADVVFRVIDFDRYYRISRSICSKQRPTDDVGSRVKSLRRWFINFPKKKDRCESGPFLLTVKPQIAKKVSEIIERNMRVLGLAKRRRRQ